MSDDDAKSAVFSMTTDHSWLTRRRAAVMLAGILLVAAGLRVVDLGNAPPGLNQDEASNIWNAWTLLNTGTDQYGRDWPVFYTRGLGANRSTLFIYYLIPFQAVGGLNVWTARFAAAVAGVAAVFFIYAVGERLFCRTAGLLAAGLLALNPWHIQQSRWAHEASIVPLLVLVPVALALWANLPIARPRARARPILALLAGIAGGVACYGYPAVRLFLPLMLIFAVIATWRGWREMLRTRRGALAAAAFVVGAAATFGPLGWQHVTAGDEIARRGSQTWVWDEADTAMTRTGKVLERYADHYGPGFLFLRGDRYAIQSPPGIGQFHWYALPLVLAGVGAATWMCRRSRAARVVLIWVVLYPAADVLSAHDGPHALRSLPGLPGLILLMAFGAHAVGAWLHRRGRFPLAMAATVLAIALVGFNAMYLPRFFGSYNRRWSTYDAFHVDLLEGSHWLRPRLDDTDAIFVTVSGTNSPYLITLVGLRYDAEQWFDGPKEIDTSRQWDICLRYGKLHFLYPPADETRGLVRLLRKQQADRALLIVRPGRRAELAGQLPLSEPLKVIRRPDGETALVIFEAHP